MGGEEAAAAECHRSLWQEIITEPRYACERIDERPPSIRYRTTTRKDKRRLVFRFKAVAAIGRPRRCGCEGLRRCFGPVVHERARSCKRANARVSLPCSGVRPCGCNLLDYQIRQEARQRGIRTSHPGCRTWEPRRATRPRRLLCDRGLGGARQLGRSKGPCSRRLLVSSGR